MTRFLTGKVALVTGAAKGIGAGIAKAMAAAGASVVVNFASDRPGAERVVADIKVAGGNAFAAQANVTVVAEVERLFADAVATFGPLDILVNNASVLAFASLEQTTDEQIHKMLDTNLWGTIMTCREAAIETAQHDVAGYSVRIVTPAPIPPFAAVYTREPSGVRQRSVGGDPLRKKCSDRVRR